MSEDRSGEIIEKYQLIRLLGEGGMGQVYLAEHRFTKRRVAVKVLFSRLAGNETLLSRFQKEAQAASLVNHSNIVEIIDYGLDPGGCPYISMELLNGEDLRHFLQRVGRISIPLACHIISEVLDTMATAHANGVIHRDLKPENVFVHFRQSPPWPQIKILDFGIGKFTSAEFEDQSLTKTGAVLGTPYYMSYEQANGQKIDYRADIYSIAVILYQVLTGTLPFKGTTVGATFMAIASGDFQPPQAHRPEIPAVLSEAILKGMSRDKNARFQSCSEFRNILLPFFHNMSLQQLFAYPADGSAPSPQMITGVTENPNAVAFGNMSESQVRPVSPVPPPPPDESPSIDNRQVQVLQKKEDTEYEDDLGDEDDGGLPVGKVVLILVIVALVTFAVIAGGFKIFGPSGKKRTTDTSAKTQTGEKKNTVETADDNKSNNKKSNSSDEQPKPDSKKVDLAIDWAAYKSESLLADAASKYIEAILTMKDVDGAIANYGQLFKLCGEGSAASCIAAGVSSYVIDRDLAKASKLIQEGQSKNYILASAALVAIGNDYKKSAYNTLKKLNPGIKLPEAEKTLSYYIQERVKKVVDCNQKRIAEACHDAGQIYAAGHAGPDVTFQAPLYLGKACDLKLRKACPAAAGVYMAYYGVNKDPLYKDGFYKYAKLACNYGFSQYCNMKLPAYSTSGTP
ncbi:serine/threonine protein kinase [Myxococcota bacterium]|nr:serine/threonine protein kinase [Myxococcota bacterium]MBU1379436.1 serine/threonine protein kinase [Myxococcota bacterium]MBU1497638.1 serine/threonine protein kinase [Myxococcota bacterium]